MKQNLNIFQRFAVGGDGKVYEGRGFNVVGAHAPAYNDKSIGICLIGDWQSILLVLINNVLTQNIYINFNGSCVDVITFTLFNFVKRFASIG